MNSSELLELFRSEMADTVAPYLWSDVDAYGYMDEGQKRFCRKTDGIADARTAAVTQIAIVPSTDWYTTHAAILNIRKATRADTGRKVELYTAEQADSAGIIFDGREGPVKGLVLGLEPRAVRVTPMPNETVTINLSVYRLPLVTITDDGDQEFEIDEQHHRALLDWMKCRAYGKQDAETVDRRKEADYMERFDMYCAKAQLEQERARRVHGNVVYGGV